MSAIGSTAPVSVVPAVATTAIGVIPAARSRSIASASAAGSIRRCCRAQPGARSRRRCRAARPPASPSSGPRPSSTPRAVAPPSPRARAPGSARSRAAASAVRLLRVPPLVKAPPPTGKPISSPTQRTACSSISLARAGVDGQVGVVAGGQCVGHHAHRQPRRPHEGEVPRPRLGDRLVQDAGGLGQHLGDRLGPVRQRLAQHAPHRLVDRAAVPAGRGRSSSRPR